MSDLSSNVLWERLRLDLKGLHSGDYVSLGPALVALNVLIDPSVDYQRTVKSLNFFKF